MGMLLTIIIVKNKKNLWERVLVGKKHSKSWRNQNNSNTKKKQIFFFGNDKREM